MDTGKCGECGYVPDQTVPDGFYVDHGDGQHRVTLADSNPYASGVIEVPNPFGGVSLFAVMDDGGTLCERCVTDPTNPVHPDDDSRDGWGVVGWDTTGNTDSGVVCDHCGRVLQEEWADDEPEDDPAPANSYVGPGGLLDEIRQAERLLGES